ncbi:MAG: hypothetical protein NZ889_02455 [Candidatus Pacearchaeota archaeon]|nr:hypothetical protein [Candidatus Pacearchaeota archaeon]
MKNKGFFFTLTVLFFITLLLLLFFYHRREYTKESVRIRLIVGNAFVETIEKNAERAAHLIGKRVLVALNDYVATRGRIPAEKNFNEIFREAFINGTLNQTLGYAEAERLLKNYTLEDWKKETTFLAEKSDFELIFYDVFSDIIVSQTTPWAIDINFTLGYVLRDEETRTMWNRSVDIIAKVPIFGLEDPLYIQEFGRDATNIIHKSPFEIFVEFDGKCNATNLILHMGTNYTGSFYVNTTGPNYLNRLKGNFSARDVKTGIESIINPYKIRLLLQNISLIDHSYVKKRGANVSIKGAEWIIMTSEEAKTYKIPFECLQPIQ